MARAPYQVLVFPYIMAQDGHLEYALFKRSDAKYWQGIAGGGEDEETPLAAAKREAEEEGGIVSESYLPLASMITIPVVNISGFRWGNSVLVVPEYSFGVKVTDKKLTIADEHLDYGWFSYNEAMDCLKWDSNKSALWELNYRFCNDILDIDPNIDVIASSCKYLRD